MPKRENGANFDSENSAVSLRQYVESLVSELEKRTDAQFLAAKEAVSAALAAAEKAVSAALVASDKQTAAAFLAAKEALKEAQEQLGAYKAASNEWRGTINDLITNTTTLISNLKAELKQSIDEKLSPLQERIAKMEGSWQYTTGQAEAAGQGHLQNRWNFRDALSILALLITLGLGLYVAISGK
jgi:hypothetical protein